MNRQFKIFNGSTWTAVKFAAFDSEKLGGKLPSAFSEVGHSHAFSAITGRPDTIAGYGITDAYTKLQIDSLLNSKLGATANAASATKLLNARTLTIGATGKTFDGTSNASWSLTEIGAAAASHTHTFASLTSKPDTLSGYGITDAATSAALDAKTWLKSNTDNRGVATIPDDYNAKFDIKGLKTNSVIGITDGGTYSALLGIRGWGDSSGGEAHELAFDSSGRILHRSGSTTAWGSWKSLIESDDSRLTDARTPKSHTLDSHTGTLSVSKGGTGKDAFAAGEVLVGNGANGINTILRAGIDTRTDFPTSWASVVSKPATATRWPTWSEVTSKPTFAAVATSGSYNDLSNKPTIPTIPSVMTATEGQTGSAATQRTISAAILKSIILYHSPAGDRPASDVYAWAKAEERPTYTWSDITSKPAWIGANKPDYTWSELLARPDVIIEGDSRLTDARTPLAHNQAWSTITNTPTTIANYGITDAYTKTQIDTWLAGKENAFTQLSVGKGGTGRSTLTAGSVLVGNGSSPILMLSRDGIDTRTVFPTNGANVATGGTAGNILIVGSDGKMTHTAGIAASKITSEVLGTARLGTGTASSSTWLRGDGTWQTLPTPANNFLSSVVNSKNGSQQTLYFSRAGLTDLNTIITGATTSEAGLMTTGTQTFAGTKTFNNDLVVGGTIQAATKTIYHAGGSFTLNTTDHTNAFVVKNTTFNITVNIPTNAAQAFPVGTEIHFYARNAGQITFSPNSGVTLQSIDNKRVLSKRYGTVTLKKIYDNEWTLFGAID